MGLGNVVLAVADALVPRIVLGNRENRMNVANVAVAAAAVACYRHTSRSKMVEALADHPDWHEIAWKEVEQYCTSRPN